MFTVIQRLGWKRFTVYDVRCSMNEQSKQMVVEFLIYDDNQHGWVYVNSQDYIPA